jgi:hypothetical protein
MDSDRWIYFGTNQRRETAVADGAKAGRRNVLRQKFFHSGQATNVAAKGEFGRAASSGGRASSPDVGTRGCSRRRYRQLRSAIQVKLLVDVMQVHLHGASGQTEFAGDFLIAQTSRYKVGDFSFA